MPVYVLPGFLTPEECADIQALFPRTWPSATAEAHAADATHHDLSGGPPTPRGEVRRSRVAFLAEKVDVTRRVQDLVAQVNGRFFGFELSGAEALQMSEYAEGDGYGWHLDVGPKRTALRKLSTSIQLSAPGDYDGGDLEIFGSPPVDRTQGAIIVFPSYLPHRVTTVTRGLRRSLVAWSVGEKPFR